MAKGMTCYERDETLCEDQMCLRVGCRVRNDRLSAESKMPARIWATDAREGLQMWSDEKWPIYSNTEYRRADIVERMAEALEAAAARFNLMGAVGPVNGADPKVGYREAMQALNSYREASNVES